ncbi:hypothetical protein H6F50_15590 [Coleofasciculus sp. FACHB-712]|uniref:hypothetical protein n=1 Tax=Coleofasciculus sp. FACHB-712 TaxID=2692789 RepID=UPI001682E952|nr:hypothetical protein [Coleofasciculus sp. FACHB-712]MBD1943763.1 hypothetical protein [Coleofasciculus sp. FACHB-712]
MPTVLPVWQGLKIETAIALLISALRNQASPGREPEVETAIAMRSCGMHGRHYKRIARTDLAAIALSYLQHSVAVGWRSFCQN